MTSENAPRLVDMILPPANVARGFLEMVVKDIPAADFARKPKGMEMNHPAWVIGHLTIYPDKALALIDRADLVETIDGAAELFEAGTVCRDAAAGDVYPEKEELLARYNRRTKVALGALAEVDNEILLRPNTLFLQKELPTVGALVNFLLNSHVMMHAGQISSWRRAMGLGPCM